jgi:excisionase family DNA binding protein
VDQEDQKLKFRVITSDDVQIEKNTNPGYNESQFFENKIATQWLSTVEAASFLRVSENALRIMVHRDQVKAYKFGRRLRFKLTDCQNLILIKGAA